MRYREGISPERLAVNSSDDMLLFTVSLALVIGVILIWLGYKGKQMWLIAWSIGLILCSIAYLGYEMDLKA